MTAPLSRFARSLSVETAFTVLAVAKRLQGEGKDVVELEIGDSPFDSTSSARRAGVEAMPNIERRGGRAVFAPLRQENAFRPELAEVERFLTEDPSPRAIFLNSPHNPTGGVATYTFCKSYSMGGWRLGFAVSSQRIADAISRMINTTLSCTSPISQLAGKAALEGDAEGRDRAMREFRRKVGLITEGCNRIEGFHALPPAGTFYVFPNVQMERPGAGDNPSDSVTVVRKFGAGGADRRVELFGWFLLLDADTDGTLVLGRREPVSELFLVPADGLFR